jgi:hypothetical protein
MSTDIHRLDRAGKAITQAWPGELVLAVVLELDAFGALA